MATALEKQSKLMACASIYCRRNFREIAPVVSTSSILSSLRAVALLLRRLLACFDASAGCLCVFYDNEHGQEAGAFERRYLRGSRSQWRLLH